MGEAEGTDTLRAVVGHVARVAGAHIVGPAGAVPRACVGALGRSELGRTG